MTVLVSVWGAAPGAGKSTLTALARAGVTLAAARRMGWPVIRVEGATERSRGDVLAIAREGLCPWVAQLR